MAKVTVIVKFPGQPLCYMQVPTDRIEKIYSSIAGDKKKLPPNMTAYLVDARGQTSVLDITGVFVICKLPNGLTGPMADMTPQDAEQVAKRLQN